MKPFNPDQKRYPFVKAALRKLSLRWPARSQALTLARVERGFYKCNLCEKIYSVKQVQVDHINPIVGIRDGFVSWDELILKLFPDVTGLQVLCESCHDGKTAVENEMRKEYRARKRKLDKKKK